MYITEVKPVLKRHEDHHLRGEYWVQLHFEVVLKCPVCNLELVLITQTFPALEFSVRDSPWLLRSIVKTHECGNCGVVSAVPTESHKNALKSIEETITPQWLNENVPLAEALV